MAAALRREGRKPVKGDIGDRFKEYESVWDFRLPRRLPLVVRVDGRAFRTLKLAKPFDTDFFDWMEATARALCVEIQGARWAYFQSDEISVVARDDLSLQSQPWLGKRLGKMLSLAAATATAAFNSVSRTKARQFDARAFVLPSLSEVENYCIWRQQDGTRNSVGMAARAVFSQGECQRKGTAELIRMLREAGAPWEEAPARFKRGAILRPVLVDKPIPRTGLTCERREWQTDDEPPVFTQDRQYLPKLWEGGAG
jgi:tRNA(His) 5'-end guanylyltransferase